MEDWKLKIKDGLGMSDEEWEKAMSISEEEIKLRSKKIDDMNKRIAEFEEEMEDECTKAQKA